MYKYQKTNCYFALVADDIKDIAEEELNSFGALDIFPSYRGLYFTADKESLYKINLNTRLLNRILAPLVSFKCPSDNILYKEASKIHWEDFLSPEKTFAVFSTVTSSNITHSQYAALRLKDAVVDYFREKTGIRPSIERINPDLWINLFIHNNNATISIDTSGGSLHRRGYRKESVSAPIIETLAAAIIKYSDWDGSKPLYDPFCGSGTILCEAYLRITNTPSAYLRKYFGFERLPDFNQKIWMKVKNASKNKILPYKKDLITGSDIALKSVKASLFNISKLKPIVKIDVKKKDVFKINNLEDRVIITNPPYGIRMNKKMDLSIFYKDLGDLLKHKCKRTTAYIYFGEREYIKNIGLRPSFKKILSNGNLDGRLTKFEIY